MWAGLSQMDFDIYTCYNKNIGKRKGEYDYGIAEKEFDHKNNERNF